MHCQQICKSPTVSPLKIVSKLLTSTEMFFKVTTFFRALYMNINSKALQMVIEPLHSTKAGALKSCRVLGEAIT